jgi:transposase InsO family protein
MSGHLRLLLFSFASLFKSQRRLAAEILILHPTATWIAQRLAEAFLWERAPRHLPRHRDASCCSVLKHRLTSLGTRDHPTAPRSSWQNGYAGRVIGSIRHECNDHTIIFGEAHLRRMLKEYAHYYNRTRKYWSLAKDSPVPRLAQGCGGLISRQHLGGLQHGYARMA